MIDETFHTKLVSPGRRQSPRTFLTLGKKNETDRLWLDSGFIRALVQFERAAPSGYRYGSRVLGLGVDSAILALRALVHRGPFLVSNPWIGIALKMLGRRNVAVIGLYAVAGSRTFRLMRRILADSLIVTTVEIEAQSWIEAGGRASAVLYGNTFHYPPHIERGASTLRLFVGGSSDRDPVVLSRLESEIRASQHPVSLVVVTGDQPSSWSDGQSSIVHTGYVSAATFGELLADADVVFLPLQRSGRAAGHMVTVGALEAGVPVATTPCEGMVGYVNGDSIIEVDLLQPLLPQLDRLHHRFIGRGAEVRLLWKEEFSRRAFVERVGDALHKLER